MTAPRRFGGRTATLCRRYTWNGFSDAPPRTRLLSADSGSGARRRTGNPVTGRGESDGLRASASAAPPCASGSAAKPRPDPGGHSDARGWEAIAPAAPPELDEPRPDEAEHFAPCAAPPRTPGSPENGLLQRIAAVVAAIPHGRVATYGQVAAQAGSQRAARQVAWALRAYADSGLPWHRVIGAGGAIRLPGDGLQRQRSLLLAEGVAVDSNGRLDLAAYQWRP